MLNQLIVDLAHNMVIESGPTIKSEVEKAFALQGTTLSDLDSKVFSASVAQGIATDASFYLRKGVKNALAGEKGVQNLEATVKIISDLRESEEYYLLAPFAPPSGHVWAKTPAEVSYAQEYDALARAYLQSHPEISDELTKYINGRISKGIDPMRSVDLANAPVKTTTHMRVYTSFLNRHKYLTTVTALKPLENLPAGDTTLDVLKNFSFDGYLRFMLTGHLASHSRHMKLAVDGDLYSYCSSDDKRPFNAIGTESLNAYFDKDGFCTFAVSDMRFPLTDGAGNTVLASMSTSHTIELEGGYRYEPPVAAVAATSSSSGVYNIPVTSSLTTSPVFKNATQYQGYFGGNISSQSSDFVLNTTYGLEYPATQTGDLCQFSLTTDSGTSTINIYNCANAPSSQTLNQNVLGISAADINGDRSSWLFLANADGSIQLYDPIANQLHDRYTGAFSFPDAPQAPSLPSDFSPETNVLSTTNWVSMESLYDRDNNDIILILAANTTSQVQVTGVVAAFPPISWGEACALQYLVGNTTFYYYTYDLDGESGMTLAGSNSTNAQPATHSAGTQTCATYGAYMPTVASYVGAYLTKAISSSPFEAASQPALTVNNIFNDAAVGYLAGEDAFTATRQEAIDIAGGDLAFGYLNNVGLNYNQVASAFANNQVATQTSPTSSLLDYQSTGGGIFYAFADCVGNSPYYFGCVGTPGNSYTGAYAVVINAAGNPQTFVWPGQILAIIDTPICNTDDPNVSCAQSFVQASETSSSDSSTTGWTASFGMEIDFKATVGGNGITAGAGTNISVGGDSAWGDMQSVTEELIINVGSLTPPNVYLQGFSIDVWPAEVVYVLDGNSDYYVGQHLYPSANRHYGSELCSIDNADCSNEYFNLQDIYDTVIGHNYLNSDSTSYTNPPATFQPNPTPADLLSYYNVGPTMTSGSSGYEIEASVTKGQDNSSASTSSGGFNGFFGAVIGANFSVFGVNVVAETDIKFSTSYQKTMVDQWTKGWSNTVGAQSSIECNGCQERFPNFPYSAALATVLYSTTYDLAALQAINPSAQYCMDITPPGASAPEQMCEKQTIAVSSSYICYSTNFNEPYCQMRGSASVALGQ